MRLRRFSEGLVRVLSIRMPDSLMPRIAARAAVVVLMLIHLLLSDFRGVHVLLIRNKRFSFVSGDI